jgi:HlyD family secretion protein
MSTDMDRKIFTPWWRRQTTLIAAATALVLLAGGAAAAVWIAGAQTTLAVSSTRIATSEAKAGVFRDFTPFRATVAPQVVVTVDAGEGGQAAEIFARPGDVVGAGQPLVRFANADLEMQVLERRQSLIGQISQLQAASAALEDQRTQNERELARIEYDIARLNTAFEQQQTLFEKGFSPRTAHDRARDELDFALAMRPLQAEVAARAEALRARRQPEIESEIAILRQSLTASGAKLEALTVRAPLAGRLSDFILTVGETRSRGQAIGKITGAAGFKLIAQIDPYYLARVRVGQSAEVSFPTPDGMQSAQVHVARVDPQVRDGVFTAELEFAGAAPAGISEGQGLDGRLSLGDDQPAVVVAAGPWLDVSGGRWAFVLRDAGTAEKRPLQTGRRNAEEVEIVSGLAPGEAIITSAYDAYDRVERIQINQDRGN